MRTKLFIGLAALLALTGCTTYVTVDSNPEGATISDLSGDRVYGYAPIKVAIDPDTLKDVDVPGVCPKTEGFRAKWASGATASTADYIKICDTMIGTSVLLERPKSAPDRDKDLEWALKLMRERAQKAEADKEMLEDRLNDPWYHPYWGPYGYWRYYPFYY